MTGRFPDHFSGVASGYAAYRPMYPEALFDALADIAPSCAVAWDCGAGTGQASLALAARFSQVIATDASEAQIAQAPAHPRVTYRVAPAHESGLEDGSVGLVTVAQALHWFDADAFHAEAQRVLMPHGVIAEWTYALLDAPTCPALAERVNTLDRDLADWWPAQRRHVNDGYANIAFPFVTEEIGTFVMEADWTLEQLLGYLGTWSAVNRQRAETGTDALEGFATNAAVCWGRAPLHRIRWPLTLRVGRRA